MAENSCYDEKPPAFRGDNANDKEVLRIVEAKKKEVIENKCLRC